MGNVDRLRNLMISACRQKGFPYIRQSASYSLFGESVLDGILIAYGTQLLDIETRRLAVSESYRTLKPGRRLVFHAFEVGESVANFFDTVVHPNSRTGHPHKHFTRMELVEYFTDAGFRDLHIFNIDDPFTLAGKTHEDAKSNAIMHVYRMYDLINVAKVESEIESNLEKMITKTLGPITINEGEGKDEFVAHIPRTTMVAVGTK